MTSEPLALPLADGPRPQAQRCEALLNRLAELETQLEQYTRSRATTDASAGPGMPTSHQVLRETEERFRLLAENSTDMISRHAPDGTYLYASPACRQILGRDPAQIVGHSAYEFIAPQDRDLVHQAHELQLGSGGRNTVTFRVCHSDGRQIWVESTTHCLLDPEGKILEIHVSTRDITDRMTAQQALIKSEAQYRSLIECATDVIFRLDPDYRIRFLNSSMSDEARKRLMNTSLFDRVAPEDHPKLREILHTVFEENQPVFAELEVIALSLESRWYAFRFAPIREDGVTIAATVIATDISPRKETEQALLLVRSAIENVQDAVVITTADLEPPGPTIVYVNKAFEKMTGYSARDVLGTNPRILQGPRTDRAVLNRLRTTLRNNQVFHGETINYRKDGSEYNLEWDISPVRNAQGQTINFVSVQRDITQQRQQEEQTRQHQAELAHVGRLSTMGEMASGLAHELNQPLTAITNYTRGCLRRLKDSPQADPKIAQAIELAALQADRAAQIIRRLRQFIRKRVPQHSPVDLNMVVHDAIALIAEEKNHHQINLELDLHNDLPMVKADYIQLEQVIVNLLRNAFEALSPLPAERHRVTIYTRRFQEGVRLSVLDQGTGLDSQTALRIFEPFFTTKNSGLGMGLPICHSIIESHNGRLWADDRNQPADLGVPALHGGLFHFWLPQINPDDLLSNQLEYETQNTLDTLDQMDIQT